MTGSARGSHGAGSAGRSGVSRQAWLPLLPLLVAVVLLGPLACDDVRSLVDRFRWERGRATPYELGVPTGTRVGPPIDMVIAVDDSGSTDRSGPARWGQVKELARWMARYGPSDRLAVLSFAGGAPRVVAPLARAISTEKALGRVARSPDGDGTAFVPSAVSAEQALRSSAEAGRRPVVVWVTDGFGEGATEAAERTAPIGGLVFGLDFDGTFSAASANWAALPAVAVDGDGRSLAHAQTELLERLTGQNLADPIRRPYGHGGMVK